MPTLDPTTAAEWLQQGPPVLFFRTAADWEAADGDAAQAHWRFTKGRNFLRTIAREKRLQVVKDLLREDFQDATPQVKAVAREAWEESDETRVIGKVCDMLDAFRDNWATFSAASKTWLRAWADKRGIKRRGEE